MVKRATLFVYGIPSQTRARDLAYEFERYGRLVRCDIPAPRSGEPPKRQYAFVEFEDPRDAEDALHGMNGRRFEGSVLDIQFAKSGGSFENEGADRRRGPPRRMSRSPSRSRGRVETRRGYSPPPRRYNDRNFNNGRFEGPPPRRNYEREQFSASSTREAFPPAETTTEAIKEIPTTWAVEIPKSNDWASEEAASGWAQSNENAPSESDTKGKDSAIESSGLKNAEVKNVQNDSA